MAASFLFAMLTFPGYINNDSFTVFKDWRESTFLRLVGTMSAFWLFYNLLSTGVTVYSIHKISNTIKLLNVGHSTGNNVDQIKLRLHVSLLILLCCVIALACIPFSTIAPETYHVLEAILAIVDCLL
jgi:hypothetical protein